MVERIREILQANQLTPTQFADSIGVARPIISHILSGRNKPSLEVVQKILAAFPQLSLDWLLKGTGTMLAGVPVAASSAAVQSATPSVSASPSVMPQVEVPSGPPPAHKATRAPRYRPQPASLPPGHQHGAEPAPASPLPDLSYAPAPVAPRAALAAEIPAVSPVVPTTQSTAPATAVSAGTVEAVVPLPATPPSPPVEAVVPKPVEAVPVQSADVSLANAFAEPGKVIRRIVIFYQDGTFTDYQPEPRLS